MANGFALDNDAIIKSARYKILRYLLDIAADDKKKPLTLAAAPFVLSDIIRRSSTIPDKASVSAALNLFLSEVELAEPTEAEIKLAAELEEEAAVNGLSLDTGESILAAITHLRNKKALITGDKRAILAFYKIEKGRKKLVDRILCFEQVIKVIVQSIGIPEARNLICCAVDVDKAISICFSCNDISVPLSDEGCLAGLMSYIAHLRSAAPGLLHSDVGWGPKISQE